MTKEKAYQEMCIMGRFLSLEALVSLMGLVSVVYGLFTGSYLSVLTGAAVLVVAVLFFLKCRQCRANGKK